MRVTGAIVGTLSTKLADSDHSTLFLFTDVITKEYAATSSPGPREAEVLAFALGRAGALELAELPAIARALVNSQAGDGMTSRPDRAEHFCNYQTT